MRQLYISLFFIILSGSLLAQPQVFFFDFGPNDTINGNITPSPDLNGAYWNNITNAASGTNILVDAANNPASATLSITQGFSANGIQNGGLLAPEVPLLGELAIATATQDYFFTTMTSSMSLDGLNPGQGYIFSFFGTRETGSTRITQFDIQGANTYTGTQQTSGAGIGANGYNGNNNQVLVSDTIIADANGNINIDVSVNQGGFAYLGLMKVEGAGVAAPPANPVLRSFLVDLGPDDVTNGNPTSSPDGNGNYWNNIITPTTAGTPVDLVTIDNATSDLDLSVRTDLLSNGIQNGGLLAPEDSLLGNFAVGTATQDYFFTLGSGALKLSGLDPGLAYSIRMFGSRNTDIVRRTEYVVEGSNSSVDTLQTSGPGIGGTGYDGNNSTIIETEAIRPNADGEIIITINVVEGNFAYLNTMEINEVDPAQSHWIDFGPNDVANGNITPSPDLNGNYWNNAIDPLVGSDTIFLVDQGNEVTGAYMWLTSSFGANGIQNGGLLAPDQALLGDFAIATATQDYFFTTGTAEINFGGLDTANGYIFRLFGTRNSASTRVTEFTLTGANVSTDTLQTSGVDLGGAGYNGNNSTVAITDTIYPNAQGKITLAVSQIEGGFAYLGSLEIQTVFSVAPSAPICTDRDSLHIAVMGSSVADGFGAINSEGYAAQYEDLLADRALAGDGLDFSFSNISVGGNSTVSLLNRFESDLLPLCSRYVIYGLSLGNEGIKQQGQAAYDRFRDNMLILIDQARTEGIEPVVVNCYTRADFDSVDYGFTKDMNLLIHEWDVASINVLGAVDDGAGRWAQGLEADPFHPNTAGHQEMAYTIVPSLFDAMAEGKAQPVRNDNTFLEINKPEKTYQLEFTPDAIVHSFTVSFDFRTDDTGVLGGFTLDDGTACGFNLPSGDGRLHYISSQSNGFVSGAAVNDGEWHTLTLTHYYGWGRSLLYLDGILVGETEEKFEPETFFLNGANGLSADYHNWFFYRSGMNQDEVEALYTGSMLKSSLELYAPLDGQSATDSLVNLAQSTNMIEAVPASVFITNVDPQIENLPFTVFPNPATQEVNLQFTLPEVARIKVSIYDLMGKKAGIPFEGTLPAGVQQIQWNPGISQASGMYWAILEVNGQMLTRKIRLIR